MMSATESNGAPTGITSEDRDSHLETCIAACFPIIETDLDTSRR
jgi:hypothetical protein